MWVQRSLLVQTSGAPKNGKELGCGFFYEKRLAYEPALSWKPLSEKPRLVLVPFGHSRAYIVQDTVSSLRTGPSRPVIQQGVECRRHRELPVLELAESPEKVGGNRVTPSDRRLYLRLADQRSACS